MSSTNQLSLPVTDQLTLSKILSSPVGMSAVVDTKKKKESSVSFKKEHSFEKRKAESDRIRSKYPDRIPVIAERLEKSDIPDLDKKKYLVPSDLTMGQFVYVIRKRIKLSADQAIFLFVNNTLVPSGTLMSQVYKDHADEDGFAYICVAGENSFGSVSTASFSEN